jgi:hypothetical protein
MTRCIRVLLAVAALSSVAAPAGAQTDLVDELARRIGQRAIEIRTVEAKRRIDPKALLPNEGALRLITLNRDFELIYLALSPQLVAQAEQVSIRALQALEERRADKQIGDAAGSTAGSTSLVAKGGTPALLAVAVENGALAQDVTGTTVTFRGTPSGLVRALGNTGYFATLETDDPAVAILQKFSFAVSFDTSRGLGAGELPTFTADRGQLSAASLRFSAVDQKDPRTAANDPRWAQFALAVNEARALAALGTLTKDKAVASWLAATNTAIETVPVEAIEPVVVTQFRALASVDVLPETRAAVDAATRELQGLLQRRADVLREIAGGAQLVFDWAYQRPAIGSESSNFKAVGSVGRSLLLTGNVSLTLNHGSIPAGADRVRDIQVATQLDIPMGNPETIGRYVASLSTKIQYMPGDIVAAEGALFPGTKGTIWLGQLKLTIPIKGVAAKIPVSVTLANRTELIPEEKVFARANVGFSYDLDAVFARFKP